MQTSPAAPVPAPPAEKRPRAALLRALGDPRGTGRVARLERTLVLVHGWILCGFAVCTLAPLTWVPDLDRTQVLARLLVVGLLVGVAVDLHGHGERVRHLVVLGLGLASARVAASAEIAGDLVQPLAFSALAISAARLLRTLPFAATLLACGTAYALTSGPRTVEAAASALDGVLLTSALAISVSSFLSSLEAGTREAEQLDEEAWARERSLHREQSQASASVAAGRVLHDDVLTALRLVADTSQQGLDHAEVRDACRASVRAVRSGSLVGVDADAHGTATPAFPGAPPEPATLGEVVDRITSRAAVAVEVDAPADLAGERLDGGLADALDRAAGEALRNVARHSGTRSAVLRVRAASTSAGRPAWVVAVVDQGVGFPPAVRHGYGLTESVLGAVAAVGGEVRLHDTPGGGATVTAAVPRQVSLAGRADGEQAVSRLETSYRSTAASLGGSLSLVHAVAWPQGAAWTYLALRNLGGAARPLLSVLVLLALVAMTLGVARRLERRPPTVRWVVATGLALTVVQAAGLATLATGGMLDYRSWAVGFVAVPTMTLCFYLPVRVGLLLVLPHPVLVLAAVVVDPDLTLGQPPLGSLNACLLTPLLGVVLGSLLRRTGRQVHTERERIGSAERALARRHAVAEVSSLHLEHTRREVVPWLDRVGAAEVDLDDPDTARTARTLSLEVRDDLYAPGLFDPTLRALVSDARQRGAVVEVAAGFAPVDPDRGTAQLLRALAPHLRPGTKLTVTSAEGRARLSMVPPDTDLLRLAASVLDGPLDIDVDDYRAVLRYDDAPDNRGMAPVPATG